MPKAKNKVETEIILVTVKGPDKPGITAALTGVIAKAESVHLIDIEQIVIHGKLILSLLLKFKVGGFQHAVLKDLLFEASRCGVRLDFEVFDQTLESNGFHDHQYVITCIGENVGAKPLHQLGGFLSKRGVNIDKIGRLTSAGLNCIEITAHAKKAVDPKQLSRELLSLSAEMGVDVAVQKSDLLRRAKRLIVFDMDSTLITTEVINELAKEAGVKEKVSDITKLAMEGKINFKESLKKRVAFLEGIDEKSLNKVYERIELTKGTRRLIKVLKRIGFKIGVISGGFDYFTDRLAQELGFDFAFANQLEISKGKLTGRVKGTIIDDKQKALLLETIALSEGVSLDQTIAIGDGANDVKMLAKAGLGIAFHAHEPVKKKAGVALSMHDTGLDAILYLLGISEAELKRITI